MTVFECWNGIFSAAAFSPDASQKKTLYTVGIMLAVITLMYQWRLTRLILYPFDIIGTVFHEFGHALACWLTGGTVTKIEINMDESGLTRFHGGITCAIIPAGYLGSSLIGGVLLFCGFRQKTSRWMAAAVGVILAATFWLGDLKTMVIALVLALGLTGAVWYEQGKYTQYLILFMGTSASVVSLLNNLSSTVFHTIDGSDATAFAKECSFLVPAFVFGIIWMILSVIFIGATLMLAIKYTKEPVNSYF